MKMSNGAKGRWRVSERRLPTRREIPSFTSAAFEGVPPKSRVKARRADLNRPRAIKMF